MGKNVEQKKTCLELPEVIEVVIRVGMPRGNVKGHPSKLLIGRPCQANKAQRKLHKNATQPPAMQKGTASSFTQNSFSVVKPIRSTSWYDDDDEDVYGCIAHLGVNTRADEWISEPTRARISTLRPKTVIVMRVRKAPKRTKRTDLVVLFSGKGTGLFLDCQRNPREPKKERMEGHTLTSPAE